MSQFFASSEPLSSFGPKLGVCGNLMKKIAIYDMDRTITRRATFTPFLIFVAKRRPLRFFLLPFFFIALLGYPLKLLDRKALKQIGFRLILGSNVTADELTAIGQSYASHVLANNVYDRARKQIATDRAEGCRLVMATASPDFYAAEIGRLLGFDHVLATVQGRDDDGSYSYRIKGANCFGNEKLRRIEEWLKEARVTSDIRFYSDHHSDRPIFEWADKPIVANPDSKLRALAKARGWTIETYA
jgi:HAD superfamily hydrolase (TIGR01490 family)